MNQELLLKVTKKLIYIKNKDDKNKFKESEKMSNKNKKKQQFQFLVEGRTYSQLLTTLSKGT